MAIYKEVFEENYTVVGSPTISDDYVLSETSGSKYVKNTMALPSSFTSLDFIAKYKKTTSTSNLSFILSDVSANRPLFINSSDKLTFYNGGSDITGTTTLRVDRTYWLRMTLSGNTLDLYTLQDDNYTVDTLPEISSWIHEVTNTSFTNNYTSKTLCLGAQPYSSSYGLHGELSLKDTRLSIDGEIYWAPVVEELVDVSGSVEISKGYYSDGSNKINMPASTYNIDALTANQTLGGKNKLFAYTDSTDSVGALITSTTPTGSFKITKELEHPVYLDPTKNYIAGGELIEPSLSFTSGTAEPWVQPVLTSATSYGVVTDSRNRSGEEGWKALDSSSSTAFVPEGAAWWKWELPEPITFTPESYIVWTHRSGSENFNGTMCRFFADAEGTIRLTDDFTDPSSSLATVSVPCIVTEPITTNVIYWTKDSGGGWGGASSINFYNVLKGAVEASVSSTKALQYSEAQDTTYWVPSEETVLLDSVKPLQSVGPVNDLYLTTTTGTPTASLSFSDDGEIVGAATKLLLKQKVYLNNATDKILGVQERPDEIVISRNATENYTVVGSPTITADYVASDFSDSNYLTCSTALPSSISSFYIVTKAKVDSFAGHAVLFANTSQEKYFGVKAASQTFSMYDSSWTEGTTVIPLDTWYWFMVTYDGTTLKGYVLRDTDYSFNTLPSVDEWNLEWTKASNWIQGVTFNIGTNTFYAGEYIRGEIDLKSIKYVADGVEWKAADIQKGITVSGWSVLYSDVTDFTGNTALDYTTPATIASSSLEIPAGYGTYTVYLYYTNGDIKYIPAGDTVLDKTVFTGYALTVSDGAIQSVNKKGELSAVFVERGYDRNTRHYLFIPAKNLKEGGYFTTKAASTSVDMSSQGTLPPSEYLARMENVAYNRYDKTVYLKDINNRIKTFDYIGDMMFSFIG